MTVREISKTPVKSGYAPVNGLEMYYEIHGEPSESSRPLILLHGGLGMIGMFTAILPRLAEGRQVIAADLQAHGRTADIDRSLHWELMGDDVAGLIRHLGLESVDILGYSTGGAVGLWTTIQHPALVNKLALVSTPVKRTGWYPDVIEQMGQMRAEAAPFMQETPMYEAYVSVAPHPENFPKLLDKMGEMVRIEYDWTQEAAALEQPILLVFGDADSVSTVHAVEFFQALGGGQGDGGWDRSAMPRARLAILPDTTHYESFASPLMAEVVIAFLDAPAPEQNRR